MNNIKSVEELSAQLSAFERDITESIEAELKRIGRKVSREEFYVIDFTEDVSPYIEAINLDENEKAVFKTSFNDIAEKDLSACISDNEIDHWNLIALLGQLKITPVEKLNIYTLKGKKGISDIQFTINDLLPLAKSSGYDFNRLSKVINYRDYDADWDAPMDKEYAQLYEMEENKTVDFFKIKGTDVIVIPGTYIYPTILNENDIKNFC